MRQLTAAISGMRPAELQGVLRELMAAAAPDADPFERVAPPSRRRPRRADVVTYRVRAAGPLPEPLGELVAAIRVPSYRRELRRLLEAADLEQPVLINAGTAARMFRPYSWLLDHVGAEGIRLTGAGHLPPAHVEAAVAELDLGEEWIGKGNREVQTTPVLHLRESATRMGLLREHRGTLLTTSRGRACATIRPGSGGTWRRGCRPGPPTAAKCRPGFCCSLR